MGVGVAPAASALPIAQTSPAIETPAGRGACDQAAGDLAGLGGGQAEPVLAIELRDQAVERLDVDVGGVLADRGEVGVADRGTMGRP